MKDCHQTFVLIKVLMRDSLTSSYNFFSFSFPIFNLEIFACSNYSEIIFCIYFLQNISLFFFCFEFAKLCSELLKSHIKLTLTQKIFVDIQINISGIHSSTLFFALSFLFVSSIFFRLVRCNLKDNLRTVDERSITCIYP